MIRNLKMAKLISVSFLTPRNPIPCSIASHTWGSLGSGNSGAVVMRAGQQRRVQSREGGVSISPGTTSSRDPSFSRMEGVAIGFGVRGGLSGGIITAA